MCLQNHSIPRRKVNATLVPQKACRTQKGCKKKKNGGGTSYKARDLLSRAAVDVLSIGHPRMFRKESVAGCIIVEHHVCTLIAMYRIYWNVETWNWVLKHRLLKMKDITVCLGNMIVGFATTNGSKIKGPMNIRVQMTNI
jgi:hypothetical protein